MIAFLQAHGSVILAVLLSLSETMAFVFPNATGLIKAITLLKGAGVKDVSGK